MSMLVNLTNFTLDLKLLIRNNFIDEIIIEYEFVFPIIILK
jgi:hypothetical protein